jgi:hypothetical protein
MARGSISTWSSDYEFVDIFVCYSAHSSSNIMIPSGILDSGLINFKSDFA